MEVLLMLIHRQSIAIVCFNVRNHLYLHSLILQLQHVYLDALLSLAFMVKTQLLPALPLAPVILMQTQMHVYV
jgi:hypothetical protein